MEVGDLALLGYPIYPYNLSYFLDRFHMLGGVPTKAGFGGVRYHHVKAAEWGNVPAKLG